jgi:hypothetical protein
MRRGTVLDRPQAEDQRGGAGVEKGAHQSQELIPPADHAAPRLACAEGDQGGIEAQVKDVQRGESAIGQGQASPRLSVVGRESLFLLEPGYVLP